MPVTIISTQQSHDLERDTGKLLSRMRVAWRIDAKHGPYIEYFPFDDFNGTTARLALEQRARDILSIER